MSKLVCCLSSVSRCLPISSTARSISPHPSLPGSPTDCPDSLLCAASQRFLQRWPTHAPELGSRCNSIFQSRPVISARNLKSLFPPRKVMFLMFFVLKVESSSGCMRINSATRWTTRETPELHSDFTSRCDQRRMVEYSTHLQDRFKSLSITRR